MAITVHPEAKALIFDLDGTLSNSLPVHVETWKIVGKKYNFDFDPNIIHEMTGRPTIEFAKRIVEQYNVDEKPEILVRMKQQAFWDAAHLLEPIEEVIARCSKMEILVFLPQKKLICLLPMCVNTLFTAIGQ